MLHNIQFILDNYTTRMEALDGLDYLVAPVVMLKEGVHAGSSGPMFYSGDEILKSVNVWNGVPVTLPHPDKDGNLVSANSPEMIAQFKVGRVYNAVWVDDSLKAEVWLELDKLNTLGEDGILETIKESGELNVSTGLFSEDIAEPGTWNGEDFSAKVVNIKPDHLALLPESKGACSWEDGCGIRANKRSMDQTMNAVYSAVQAHDTETIYHYATEIFDDYVIFERVARKSSDPPKLYRQGYAINTDGVVVFTDEPTQVKKEVEYVPITANKEEDEMNGKAKDNKCCPEKVQLLIENAATPFEETDRDWLEAMTEDQIDKLTPPEPKANEELKPKSSKEEIAAAVKAGAEGAEGTPIAEIVKDNKQTEGKVDTPEAYIQNAPAEIQSVLTESLVMHRQKKDDLVKALLANQNNSFSEDELKGMELVELKKIAKLAQVNNYEGGGGQLPVEVKEEEGLGLPKMNWEK